MSYCIVHDITISLFLQYRLSLYRSPEIYLVEHIASIILIAHCHVVAKFIVVVYTYYCMSEL